MDSDLALLNQKIDLLTRQVEAQRQEIEALRSTNSNQAILDKLEAVTGYLVSQQQRQEEWEELKRDVIPIANHVIKLSIDELAEIGTDFQGEDLLFLVKRLLRDTRLLTQLLDRLESTVELAEDLQSVGNQAFHQAIFTLDRLEREGYFAFARGGWNILERIISEFSEEDVQALGDNIVTILTTVKNLTQPEVMALTNNALQAIQGPEEMEYDPSLWALLRDLRDPRTRRGLGKLLNMVKVLAEQPNLN